MSLIVTRLCDECRQIHDDWYSEYEDARVSMTLLGSETSLTVCCLLPIRLIMSWYCVYEYSRTMYSMAS